MMMNTLRRCGLIVALSCGTLAAQSALAQVYSQFKDALPMIQRSVLNDPADSTGVPDGRMGEIGYDPVTQCMYFAAPRSGVLIVMDPACMTRVQVLRDLPEPSGIAIDAAGRKLVLTGGDGSVKIFTINPAGTADGKPTPAGTLTLDKSVNFLGEADQIRFDAKGKKAYVGHGKFLSWIQPADGAKCEKSIELPGPAKGLVLDPNSARIFVSVPAKNQIVIVDRGEWKITATWDLKDAAQNFPIALDEQNNRLFVACRNPTQLLILNSNDGKELQRCEIGDDSADCWWDPMGRRVYVSCGRPGGLISMIREVDGKFSVEHQVDTAPGARTSLFIPEKRRYVVVAPKLGDAAQGGMPTFVYIYVLPNMNDHNEPQPKSH
jgi:DNA-binding beta-propeller fold protein YncE